MRKRDGKLTVYRKCPCGETAFDFTGTDDAEGRMIYACRNCGAKKIPSDKRSKMLRAWKARSEVAS